MHGSLQVLAEKAGKEELHEVMAILHDSGNNPQVSQ